MQTGAAAFIDSMDYLDNSEGLLWQSFKQGDAEALENIYINYFDMLCFYGRQFAADDPSLVEDCIQELFIQLYAKSNRSRLSDTNSIKYYLMKSLRRSILNAQKTTARKHTKFVAEIGQLDCCEFKPDKDGGMNNEFLKKNLLQLPVRQRDAIYLRFFSELEFQEIASKMNLDIKSVYKVIYKGLANLRHMYEYDQCKSFM
jgi:RNA polymerase sigma factor (sigma-70 family)